MGAIVIVGRRTETGNVNGADVEERRDVETG